MRDGASLPAPRSYNNTGRRAATPLSRRPAGPPAPHDAGEASSIL